MAALNGTAAPAVITEVLQPTSGGNLSARKGSDTNASPHKRRKIPLACNACRDRKTRCDGGRPVCSTCLRKSTSDKCVYDSGLLITQRYVANLEDRVKDLERTTQAGLGRGSSDALDVEMPIIDEPTEDRRSESPVVRKRRWLHENQHTEQAWTAGYSTSTSYDDVVISDETVTDALNTVPSYQDGPEGLFGGSSFIAFVRSMVQTVSPSDTTSELSKIQSDPVRETRSGHRLFRGLETVADTGVNTFTLPRRRVADCYLDCFWECIHPVFPIVHKPTFLASYQTLWLSEDERGRKMISADGEDPVFLSTLNIIFALGSQFSDINPPAKRTSLADHFYQQARKLVAVDAMDTTSLAIVQLLLLTGVYLRCTRYASRCWNIVGLAITNALGIGLHLEHLRTDWKDQIKRETRRRMWYCCVVLDRLLALAFGRPKMISTSWNIPLPILVDDEYLLADGEGFQPSHLESRMGLFVYSIKLFDIMDEILSICYPQKDNTCSSQDLDARRGPRWRLDDILRLDSMLDEFLETLPLHLTLGSLHEPENHWAVQQAKILNRRFLYIRALLLRPVLLSTVQAQQDPLQDNYDDTKLQQQVATRVCVLCVETSHTLIAQLHENLPAAYCRPDWHTGWHTVHYTFACAMVLAAAGLCNLLGPECSQGSLEASWFRCKAILEHYESQIPSASKAIQVLERLQRVVYPEDNATDTEATLKTLEFGLNGFSVPNDDMFNFDSLTDAWFSQLDVDLNWQEIV